MERILGGLPMTQPLSDIPPVEEPILGGDVRSIFRPDETKLDKAKGVADAGLSMYGALVHGIPAMFMGSKGQEFQAKRFRVPETEAGKRYFDIAAEVLAKIGQAFPAQPTAFTSPANVLAGPAMAQAGAKAADVNAMAQRALQAAGGRLEKAVEKQVYSTMEKGGLPAEILQGMTQGTQSFMVPQRVEAPRNEMKLYSPAEEAALNLQRGQGRGEGFLNDLRKAGVRDEELEYTGLKDFLAGKQNVSKKEIQDYLAGNKVQVSETQLGAPEAKITYYNENQIARAGFDRPGYVVYDRNGRFVDGPFDDLTDAEIRAEGVSESGGSPKYSQYTLPGGENYREILLTLPSKAPSYDELTEFAKRWVQEEFDRRGNRFSDNQSQVDQMKDDIWAWNDLWGEAAAEKYGLDPRSRIVPDHYRRTVRVDQANEYRSSHWDQPNVLAHLRVNDRVDADGKKMLLIEEIQSDWHQAGREKGYTTKPAKSIKDIENEITQVNRERARLLDEAAALPDNRITEFVAMNRRSRELTVRARELGDELDEMMRPKDTVPDAPFKEDWYQLVLKRALQEAVDKGYDRVGLLTGSRQAERYDLSKQVDEIAIPSVLENGSRSVRIDPVQGTSIKLMVDDKGVVTGYGAGSTQFSGKKLSDVIGKELADKVMRAEPDTRLTGLDLKVGGEGMKKYYDEIYPGFLNKYGKKFDAKVGETTLKLTEGVPRKGISGESEPVRYIDITPKMKEALSKGQPMFKEGGLVSSDAISTQSSSSDDPFRSGRPLRQRTRRPATQEENEALNRAVLQGAANMPYNLVGAPADIGNLLLTPLGLGSEQPVLSSDWIKQKMTDLGVRPEMPTDPTQRGLYSAADIGSSLVNPAAPMRAIASGAERAGAAIGRDLAPKAGEMVEDLLRKQGLLLDAAPTGKSPQTVSIYHGGNTGLEEIKSGVGPGNIFGGIFGSQDRRVAASHGDGSVYRIDVPKDEILSQQMLDSMDHLELAGALKKAMPWLKKEDVDDAFRAVIEDKAHKVNDDSLMRIFREDSPGEAGWEAQRIRGEVARLLGKKAVEMADEHGVSYLILPGAKPILDVDKKAEGGLVSNTDTIKARLIEQGMPEDKAFMQALKLANQLQRAA